MPNFETLMRRRVRIATALGAAILACIGLGATMQQSQSDWIQHSYEVMRLESEMRITMVVRDSSMLRYVFDVPTIDSRAGDRTAVMQEIEDAYVSSEILRAQLLTLTADNTEQVSRLQTIGGAMARIRARLDELRDDMKEGRNGAAQALLADPGYEADRRVIRATLQAFADQEAQLLNGRERAHTRWALVLWGALAALVMLVVATLHALRSRVVSEVAHTERQRGALETQLDTDAATGLHSRHWLAQQFSRDPERQLGNTGSLSIILLCIDSLKPVRDAWGFEARDVLLRAVLERINRVLGPSDVLVRAADDQIAILVPDRIPVPGGSRAATMAVSLAGQLDTLIDIIDGLPVSPAVRVGTAAWPADGGTLDALLTTAGDRMRPLSAFRASGDLSISTSDSAAA